MHFSGHAYVMQLYSMIYVTWLLHELHFKYIYQAANCSYIKYCCHSCRNCADHVSRSGTSMACSMIAGAVALLLQRFPNYTPAQIKQKLQEEATEGVINMITHQGSFLPSVIKTTTKNLLFFTQKAGQCGMLVVKCLQFFTNLHYNRPQN